MVAADLTATARPADGPLPRWRLAAYGAPASALAILVLPVQAFVPTLYSQDVGLDVTTVAAVLVIARIWDMLTDPAIGILSDHTPARFGRRRFWMALGLLPLMAGCAALLLPPADAGALHLLFSLIAVYTFGTMVIVPMNAWGAELTRDHHEYTRIVAFRTAAGLAGVLVAISAPALAGLGTNEVTQSTAMIAWIGLALLPLTIGLALVFTPERPVDHGGLPRSSLRGLLMILRDPRVQRLYATFFLTMMANGLPATLFLLYVKHVLGLPDQAGAWMVLYFGSTIVSLPLWTWASRRWGKRESWIGGLAVASVFFVVTPFLGPGDAGVYTVLVVILGVCGGATLTLPSSMLADLVEEDAGRFGRSRAGLYFSAWGAMSKLSSALAAGLAFALLGLADFDATAQNSPTAVATLGSIYGFGPMLLSLAAIMVLWGYRAGARDDHAGTA